MRQLILISCILIGCQSIAAKKSLDDMFIKTKIVKRILDSKPGKLLSVIVEKEGKKMLAEYVEKREATEARSNNYVVDLPEEPFDTWRFVLHSYLYEDMDDLLQIIAWLEMNRNRYRLWDRDYKYHENLLTSTRNYFRKEHVITDDFYENYPINCKFLGSKKIKSYDLWLYGRQQEQLPIRPLRKYARLRTHFNLRKFIDRYSLKLTHGATVENYCTMKTVEQMKIILLPFVIVLGFIGLYGAIFMVYSEVERERQAKRAEARAAKEREERENQERWEEMEALEREEQQG